MEYGADSTLKNNRGETPLEYVPNLWEYEKICRDFFPIEHEENYEDEDYDAEE